MIPPVLQTERLILRAPRSEDFPPFAAILASPRARYMGGGPCDSNAAYRSFTLGLAQWLLTGFGVWSIEERATRTYLGDVGLLHPPHFPEIELGWTLTADAEGLGIAFEAARAARDWAWANLSMPSLVSYIDRDNARSIRLAERLGARPDPDAPRPDPEDLVYRHARPA